MIRRDIQDCGHPRMKAFHGLKLKAADLSHRHGMFGGISRDIRIGITDISHDKGGLKMPLHDLSHKCRSGGLSVGPGDGYNLPPLPLISQLDLAPDRYASLTETFHKGRIRRNTGT